MLNSKKHEVVLGLCAIGLICVGVIVIVMPKRLIEERWDAQAQTETAEIATAVLVALDSYKEEHGEFPTQLGDLVPDYIDGLPDPVIGSGEWSYQITKLGYSLTVASANNEPPSLVWMFLFGTGGYDDRVFTYYPSLGRWEIADM